MVFLLGFGGEFLRAVVAAHVGSLGHGQDAEPLAPAAPFGEVLADAVQVVRDFRDEDDVRPAGQARRQRQPPCLVAHQLDDHDAQVGLGRRVQPVHRLGGGGHRRIVAEGGVGFDQVVVDGLGQAQDIEPVLHQAKGDLVRAIAAQADQAVKTEALVGFDGPSRQVHRLAVGQRHAVRLLATGAEDSAAGREDIGDIIEVQGTGLILDEAAKAFLDPDDLDVEIAERRLDDTADGRIQARTIAAAGEDADAARTARGRHDRRLPWRGSSAPHLSEPEA